MFTKKPTTDYFKLSEKVVNIVDSFIKSRDLINKASTALINSESDHGIEIDMFDSREVFITLAINPSIETIIVNGTLEEFDQILAQENPKRYEMIVSLERYLKGYLTNEELLLLVKPFTVNTRYTASQLTVKNHVVAYAALQLKIGK